jgi:hypothetical protein
MTPLHPAVARRFGPAKVCVGLHARPFGGKIPTVEDERTEASRGDVADAPEVVSADLAGESGWVTTKVAAEALGVNPRTVRAYIERGDLKARAEGEGIQKAYLVSIDSVFALRERRGASAGKPRRSRPEVREKSAGSLDFAERRGSIPGGAAGVPAEDLTSMIRDLTADLMQRTADAAELRTRLELTAQAESTLREALERERERADRLEAELREARTLPPEPRDVPQSAAEDTSKRNVPPEPQEPLERRSSWWRRFFGFED